MTARLYSIHCEIFDGVTESAFREYVIDSAAEITRVALFTDSEDQATGYCSVHFYEREIGGRPCIVVRSEVGVRRAHRGGGAPGRFFSREVAKYRLRHPRRRMVMFSCLVHPSSFMAAAKRAEEMWPSPTEPTPPEMQALMLELGDSFALERVDPDDPMLREVGWITRATPEEHEYWRSCEHPVARYYVGRNPGYVRGHGLMTIVPMNAGAMARTLARFAGQQVRSQAMRVRAKLDRVTRGRVPNAENAVAALERSSLFADLDPEATGALLTGARKMVFAPGDFLFREGDRGDAMYVLVQGSAYVQLGRDPELTILDQLSVGDIVGEVALATGAPRSADVRAAKSVTALQISLHALSDVMTSHPDAAERIWRRIAWIRLDNFARQWSEGGRAERKRRFEAGRERVADDSCPRTGELFLFEGYASCALEQGPIRVAAPALLPAGVDVDAPPGARFWWLPPPA